MPWEPPSWMDAIWPDVQRALRDSENETYRRAFFCVGKDVVDQMRYSRAWTDDLGTRSDMVRVSLTVWWWDVTGETRFPVLEDIAYAASVWLEAEAI